MRRMIPRDPIFKFRRDWTCSNCGHAHHTVHVKRWWESGVVPLFCPHCLTEQLTVIQYEFDEDRKNMIRRCFLESHSHAFYNFIGASMFNEPSNLYETNEEEKEEDT